MIDALYKSSRFNMFILDKFACAQNCPRSYSCCLQTVHHIIVVELRSPFTDEFVEGLSILNTRSIHCETRILGQFRLTYCCGERSELCITFHGNSAPLVVSATWVNVMWCKEAMEMAVALPDIPIDGIFHDGGLSPPVRRASLPGADPF